MAEAYKVLFLAANPSDTTRLRVEEEYRQIEQAVSESQYRDYLQVKFIWEVRTGDLIQLLLREQPHIVHFSGHGSPEDQLVFLGDDNRPQVVGADVIADLFGALKDNIKIIILNACYTDNQARMITRYIDFAIGMYAGIRDDAALKFAAGFYLALGYGRTVQEAFNLGVLSIRLAGLPGDKTPVLMPGPDADPNRFRFTGPHIGLGPEARLALEELNKLITSIRQESSRFLHDYHQQYLTRVEQGQDEETIKAELFRASWDRIDKESDCSKMILDINIGLKDRTPGEWATFFRNQQALFKRFQEAVHEAASARRKLLDDLKRVRDEYTTKLTI